MRYLFQDSAVRRKESPPANRIRVTSETSALIEAAVPDGSAHSPCDAFPDVACFLTPIVLARSDAGRSRRFTSPPFPTGIAAVAPARIQCGRFDFPLPQENIPSDTVRDIYSLMHGFQLP
jgi:hypothetical protein